MLKTFLIMTTVSGVIISGRDCLVRNADRAASVGRFLGIGTKSVVIDVSAFNLSRSIPAVTTTTLLQATRTTEQRQAESGVDERPAPGRARFAKTSKGSPVGGW